MQGFKQVPPRLRALVFSFFVLSFVVMADICVTSSRISSFLINVFMRDKSYISNTFRSPDNFERVQKHIDTINGSLLLHLGGKERNYKAALNEKEKAKQLNDTSSEEGINKINVNYINEVTLQYNILGNQITNGVVDNKRKDECNNCFNHDFKYVIDNLDICKLYSGQTEIELFIMIFTVHKNVHQRNALRETWLTYSKNNTASVRYVFLLGEISNTKLNADVSKESDMFRDIIKEDFVDVYANLTYKTIMGFKWVATKCGVAKAVLKIDDDMYLNMPNLLTIVRNNFSSLRNNIVGHCLQKAGPIRKQNSKWFAPVNSYPGKNYPGFCSGTGYLTSLNIAQKVFEISSHVPFFHLEDVYVALCIKKLGYHVKSFPGFYSDYPKLDACLYNGKSVVTVHKMAPEMIRQMWKAKCIRHNSN